MSKTINLGKKSQESKISKTVEKTVYYPTIHIENETEIDLTPKDVGKTISATTELKFVGIRQEKRSGGKIKFNYDFEVHTIQFNK